MPCDRISQVELNMLKVPDPEGFLAAALRAGMERTGQRTFRTDEGLIVLVNPDGRVVATNVEEGSEAEATEALSSSLNAVKREYARGVIAQAAQRYSWKVEAKSATQFRVTRGGRR